jgi:hypothetical protein
VASLKRRKPAVKAPAPSLTLTIQGKPYDVRPIEPGGFGGRAWRLSGPKGQIYDVVRTHLGICEFDCPSYEFRLKGNCITPCKHGAALVAVGLLEPPCPVEPGRDAWEDFDSWRVELGPGDDDRAWHDERTRPVVPDDFPQARPGARQPCPPPMDDESPEAFRA